MSEKKFRVGVIGFGHMHINDVMRRFNELSTIEWVACADTVPDVPETSDATFTRAWNRRYARETIGIPKVYDDYREMLEREQFDLVLVYCENAKHAEVVEAVAAKGAHMVVEKPMAATLAEALRMVRAARAAGVTLAINWPSTWTPAIRTVKELLDAGVIGRPLELKYRAGHSGPLAAGAAHQGITGEGGMTDADRGRTWWHRAGTGGGALLDFCSYGACFARWYFGEPAVAAIALAANLNSPYAQTEDNAILAVRFPRAMALLEASWTTLDHGVPTGPIVYGETGTLVVERQGEQQVVKIARGRGAAPEYVEAEPLPAGRQNIAQEITHHLATGEPLHPTLEPEFNLDAMAILDAGVRSVQSGKLELVNNACWCIG